LTIGVVGIEVVEILLLVFDKVGNVIIGYREELTLLDNVVDR
jgi:hypothetical protein